MQQSWRVRLLNVFKSTPACHGMWITLCSWNFGSRSLPPCPTSAGKDVHGQECECKRSSLQRTWLLMNTYYWISGTVHQGTASCFGQVTRAHSAACENPMFLNWMPLRWCSAKWSLLFQYNLGIQFLCLWLQCIRMTLKVRQRPEARHHGREIAAGKQVRVNWICSLRRPQKIHIEELKPV